MRRSFLGIFFAATLLGLWSLSGACSWAGDYESRFVRNYPPGYYGMYYFAQRFFEKPAPPGEKLQSYRYDKEMSKNMEIEYPFYPIPYPWDYGTGRTFNLPDYNSNDWP